jgi:hypothetical protein
MACSTLHRLATTVSCEQSLAVLTWSRWTGSILCIIWLVSSAAAGLLSGHITLHVLATLPQMSHISAAHRSRCSSVQCIIACTAADIACSPHKQPHLHRLMKATRHDGLSILWERLRAA